MIECRADILKQIGFKLEKEVNPEESRESNEDYYFYRGHSDRNYQITPYAFRDDVDEYDNYHNALQKHSNEFVGLKPLEILSKLQHYETPTRLMDISKSPLVAAYFAISGFGKILKDDKLYPEVLEFRLQEENIKKYDSDTVKILSHLPFLKSEERKELRIDAINSLLINSLVESTILPCWINHLKDFKVTKLALKTFLNVLIKNLNESADEQMENTQRLENGERVSIDYDKGLNCFEHIDHTKDDCPDCVKEFLSANKDGDLCWSFSAINLEKLSVHFPGLRILLENNFSFIISNYFNRKKPDGKDGNRLSPGTLMIILPDFGDQNLKRQYYTSVFSKIDNRYFIKENGFAFWNKDYTNKCSMFVDSDGNYISYSMDLLQYQISQNYPTFRPCAMAIDLLNGVYVNPCITTDRMRAQRGAFMLFGLSRYWDIERCGDFLYKALSKSYKKKKVENECENTEIYLTGIEQDEIFKEIVKFLVDNNPIVNEDGIICEFFNKYEINLREFENCVFKVRRFKASNRLKLKARMLERLDYQDINEETLGCSLENSYNYLKSKVQRKQS